MPNHTYTEVRIQGQPFVIDAFASHLSDLASDDNETNTGFLELFLGDPAKGGHEDWYNLRINEWGTKWDVYRISDVKTDYIPFTAGFMASRIVTCKWASAWSPPIPALLKLSKKYDVDIIARYADEFLNYVGQHTIIDGEENKVLHYEEDDVYRGVFEVFGPDHLLDVVAHENPEWQKHVYKMARKFADKHTLSRLKKQMLNSKSE